MKATRGLTWITIASICALALAIQQTADQEMALIFGLPSWVVGFILLQVALSVTAAWIARR